MSIQKNESIIIGSGDMTNNVAASQFYSGSADPAIGLGKDGDVYLKVSGVSSDIFIKVNSAWVSLTDRPTQATVLPGQVDLVLLSLPLSNFKYVFMDYTITRGVNIQQGRIEIVSDGNPGLSGAALANYAINELGAGNVGVSFNAQVNGGATHIECLITTDAQIDAVVLKYTIKAWN